MSTDHEPLKILVTEDALESMKSALDAMEALILTAEKLWGDAIEEKVGFSREVVTHPTIINARWAHEHACKALLTPAVPALRQEP